MHTCTCEKNTISRIYKQISPCLPASLPEPAKIECARYSVQKHYNNLVEKLFIPWHGDKESFLKSSSKDIKTLICQFYDLKKPHWSQIHSTLFKSI